MNDSINDKKLPCSNYGIHCMNATVGVNVIWETAKGYGCTVGNVWNQDIIMLTLKTWIQMNH